MALAPRNPYSPLDTRNPYEPLSTPNFDTGSAGLNTVGSIGLDTLNLAPPPMPVTGPQVLFSPSTNQMFVNGAMFDADNHQSALDSIPFLEKPPAKPTSDVGDWITVSPEVYGNYINNIRDPSMGRLVSKNLGLGVSSGQMLIGRFAQFLGAEDTGQSWVDDAIKDMYHNQPYQREMINESGEYFEHGAIDWFVANLAQQGPFLLESVAVALAGAAAGAASGLNPISAIGGGLAALVGKESFKQATIAAAKKYAKGAVLNNGEKKLLREATGMWGAALAKNPKLLDKLDFIATPSGLLKTSDFAEDLLFTGAQKALRGHRTQSAMGGGAIAAFGNAWATGVGDVYGEMRDTGTGSKAEAAAWAGLYAMFETIPEFFLASRVLGSVPSAKIGIKGTGKSNFMTKAQQAIESGGIGRRAGKGLAVGSVLEGLVEAGQEAILLSSTGQFSDADSVRRLMNSFAAGASIGGTVGGLANMLPQRTEDRQSINLLNPDNNAEPTSTKQKVDTNPFADTGPRQFKPSGTNLDIDAAIDSQIDAARTRRSDQAKAAATSAQAPEATVEKPKPATKKDIRKAEEEGREVQATLDNYPNLFNMSPENFAKFRQAMKQKRGLRRGKESKGFWDKDDVYVPSERSLDKIEQLIAERNPNWTPQEKEAIDATDAEVTEDYEIDEGTVDDEMPDWYAGSSGQAAEDLAEVDQNAMDQDKIKAAADAADIEAEKNARAEAKAAVDAADIEAEAKVDTTGIPPIGTETESVDLSSEERDTLRNREEPKEVKENRKTDENTLISSTEFNPPEKPTLIDRRDEKDLKLTTKLKGTPIAGGSYENDLSNPRRRLSFFDRVGWRPENLWWQNLIGVEGGKLIEDLYGLDILKNIKLTDENVWTGYAGAHHNGGIVLQRNYPTLVPINPHIVAHELGHASHSLMGDMINDDPKTLDELKNIENLLYPNLRSRIEEAIRNGEISEEDKKSTFEFFNYLLSPEELIAEFNVYRIANQESIVDNPIAPKILGMFLTGQESLNLIKDRTVFPVGIGNYTIKASENWDGDYSKINTWIKRELTRNRYEGELGKRRLKKDVKEARDKKDPYLTNVETGERQRESVWDLRERVENFNKQAAIDEEKRKRDSGENVVDLNEGDKDAVSKRKTKTVDDGEQAGTSEEISGRDSEGDETTDEGKGDKLLKEKGTAEKEPGEDKEGETLREDSGQQAEEPDASKGEDLKNWEEKLKQDADDFAGRRETNRGQDDELNFRMDRLWELVNKNPMNPRISRAYAEEVEELANTLIDLEKVKDATQYRKQLQATIKKEPNAIWLAQWINKEIKKTFIKIDPKTNKRTETSLAKIKNLSDLTAYKASAKASLIAEIENIVNPKNKYLTAEGKVDVEAAWDDVAPWFLRDANGDTYIKFKNNAKLGESLIAHYPNPNQDKLGKVNVTDTANLSDESAEGQLAKLYKDFETLVKSGNLTQEKADNIYREIYAVRKDFNIRFSESINANLVIHRFKSTEQYAKSKSDAKIILSQAADELIDLGFLETDSNIVKQASPILRDYVFNGFALTELEGGFTKLQRDVLDEQMYVKFNNTIINSGHKNFSIIKKKLPAGFNINRDADREKLITGAYDKPWVQLMKARGLHNSLNLHFLNTNDTQLNKLASYKEQHWLHKRVGVAKEKQDAKRKEALGVVIGGEYQDAYSGTSGSVYDKQRELRQRVVNEAEASETVSSELAAKIRGLIRHPNIRRQPESSNEALLLKELYASKYVDKDYAVNTYTRVDPKTGDKTEVSVKIREYFGEDGKPFLAKGSDSFYVPVHVNPNVKARDVRTVTEAILAARKEDISGRGEGNYKRISDDTVITDPLPRGKLEFVVRQVTKKLKSTPKITIVKNVDELRARHRKLYNRAVAGRETMGPDGMESDFDNTKASGYSVGDQVILFSDNIRTEQEAKFVVAHEVLGHFGLRAFMPRERLVRVLREIYLNDSHIRETADRIQDANQMPILEAIEEAIADRAAHIDTNTWSRIWESIKLFFQKILGVPLDGNISRYIIFQSRRNLRRGGWGIFSPNYMQENINELYAEAEHGRYATATERADLASTLFASLAQNQAPRTAGNYGAWPAVQQLFKNLFAGLGSDKEKLRVLKDFMGEAIEIVQTLDNVARKSPGLSGIFEIFQMQQGLVRRLQQEYWDLTKFTHTPDFNIKGLTQGPSPTELVQAGELLAYAAAFKKRQLSESLFANMDSLFIEDPSGVAIPNPAVIEQLKQLGRVTKEDFKAGIPVTLDIESRLDRRSEVYKPKFEITDNIWKIYTENREAVDRAAVDLYENTLESIKAQRKETLDNFRKITGVGGSLPTDADVYILSRIVDEYMNLYQEDATFTKGDPYKKESKANAEAFIRAINRAIWKDLKIEDWKAGKEETAQFQGDQFQDIIDGLERLNVLFGPESNSETSISEARNRAFKITNAIRDLYTNSIKLRNAEVRAKGTIAGAYVPFSRRGTHQVMLKAFSADGKLVELPDLVKSSMPYYQTNGREEAAKVARRLEETFGDKQFDIVDTDDPSKKITVTFKAEWGAVRGSAPVSDTLNLDEFSSLLERFNINLSPKERERIIEGLTDSYDTARDSLMRSGREGWSTDVIRSVAEHLERSAHMSGKARFRYKLKNILLDDSQWRGDPEKLKDLRNTMEEAERSGNIEVARSAQVAYDKYARMYMYSADAGLGKTVTLFKRDFKTGRRVAIEVPTKGQGERYRTKANQLLSWYGDSSNIDQSTEDFLSTTFSGRLKFLTVLMQLGGSIGTALVNLMSIVLNAPLFLATYNPKKGFGGGFGYLKSYAEVTKAGSHLYDKKLDSLEFTTKLTEVKNSALRESYRLSPDEAVALRNATGEGVLQAARFNALVGTSKGSLGANKTAAATRAWMFFFSYTEQFNRRTTFLAAYRLERDRQLAANVSKEQAHATAEIFAKDAVNTSQGEYAMYNRPEMARGNVLQYPFIYKQFQIIVIELFAGMSAKDKIVFLGMLLLLAGVKGIPFADDFMDLFDTLVQRFRIPIPTVEKWLAEFTNEISPGLTPVVMRGFLDTYFGISVSQRLGFGNVLPLTGAFKQGADPWRETKDFLGPMYSAMEGTVHTTAQTLSWLTETAGLRAKTTRFSDIMRESPVQAFRILGDSYRWYNDGKITNNQGRLISPEVTAANIFWRLMGFYPSASTFQNDIVRMSKETGEYVKYLKKHYVQRAVKARISEDWDDYDRQIRYLSDWNRRHSGTEFSFGNFMQSINRAYKAASLPTVFRYQKYAPKGLKPEIALLVDAYGLDVESLL